MWNVIIYNFEFCFWPNSDIWRFYMLLIQLFVVLVTDVKVAHYQWRFGNIIAMFVMADGNAIGISVGWCYCQLCCGWCYCHCFIGWCYCQFFVVAGVIAIVLLADVIANYVVADVIAMMFLLADVIANCNKWGSQCDSWWIVCGRCYSHICDWMMLLPWWQMEWPLLECVSVSR